MYFVPQNYAEYGLVAFGMSAPSNHRLDRVLTPTHSLWLGIALFLMALYPLLTLRVGRPTGWFGEFAFLFCSARFMLDAPH
jgi:hypothetical protein